MEYQPEVGGLKTGRTRLVDVEDVLEVLVEGVEETVTEAPEEEEGGDKGDGPDGFADGQLRSAGDAAIGRLETPALENGLDAHGEGAFALGSWGVDFWGFKMSDYGG